MSDKPILFNPEMVRALLAGTKTQTRRVLTIPKLAQIVDMAEIDPELFGSLAINDPSRWGDPFGDDGAPMDLHSFPRIKVGDRLWVRESWNWTHVKHLAPGETLGRTEAECADANGGFACPCGDGIVYAASNAHEHPIHGKAIWRPSIHMPRWASRITLTVNDVRVQRLREISEEDAIAEGVPNNDDYPGSFAKEYCSQCGGSGVYGAVGDGYGATEVDCAECATPELRYRNLWDHINGPGSWDANPWVEAVSFTVQKGNIDQIGGGA